MYRVDLGDAKRGHEQKGKRLGVCLSSAPAGWSTMTVAPTSTSAQDAVFRPRMTIAGRSTVILIDQVRTIDISYVFGDPVDYLTGTDMGQIEHALGLYLGLKINPDWW
ncbi:type II toxin-antitoxin system PemK/MazF family toxin [Streptomyces sp. NPDC096538]|uniref:type II toxin-antitoxin system PemK/MazF family toxin n=1 Tax=Streptomyces TaxID=1883 RepID=UPI0033171402